tara:strand:- start:1399 stop:2397 length:999 start_codon:yes stop_codon:yes gene_type:complete
MYRRQLQAIQLVLWVLLPALPVRAAIDFSNPLEIIVEEVSDFVNSQLGPSEVGASYAALINFAGNPDISTATYNIDAGKGSTAELNVGRFSYRHRFGKKGDSWRPYLQGFIPYESLQYDLNFTADSEDADARWEAVGLILTGGSQFFLSERLTLTPAINVGAFQLESNAGYRGAVSESILDPAFQGQVFDWTAYAWVLGASFWMDYSWEFRTFDAALHTGATYNHVESFSSTSDEIAFSSEALTVSGSFETIHSTPISLNGNPISLVFSVGATAILGPAGRALGFSSFTDYGAAVQMDVSRMGWPVTMLELGVKVIYGPGVTGWSLILNYDF